MSDITFSPNTILLSTISPEKLLLLNKHLLLVIQYNKKVNLTRIDSESQGILLHIEDSLTALPEINASPEGLYIDIGTGGGFPGIPMSVVSGRRALLIDSLQKKIKVVDSMIAGLGLRESISTYAGRIENYAAGGGEKASVVTARALSSLPSLLELAAPVLISSGRLVCYKANIEETELSQAVGLEKKLGMKIVSDRGIILSDGITKRRIITFEKADEAQVVIPRRAGMAQKRPYSK